MVRRRGLYGKQEQPQQPNTGSGHLSEEHLLGSRNNLLYRIRACTRLTLRLTKASRPRAVLRSVWTMCSSFNRSHSQRKPLALEEDMVFFSLVPFPCPLVPDINKPFTKKHARNPETKAKQQLTLQLLSQITE